MVAVKSLVKPIQTAVYIQTEQGKALTEKKC